MIFLLGSTAGLVKGLGDVGFGFGKYPDTKRTSPDGSGVRRRAGIGRSIALSLLILAGQWSIAPPAMADLNTPLRQPAPAFDLRDLGGATHRLAEYRGSVVLVNFWASWCPPCIAEMPSMMRLRDALESKPFHILAVNVSEDPRRVRQFFESYGFDLVTLLDGDGSVFKRWGGGALPASFILGLDGLIRYRVVGPVDWDEPAVRAVIEELLL